LSPPISIGALNRREVHAVRRDKLPVSAATLRR
jgi:hypothetical protein